MAHSIASPCLRTICCVLPLVVYVTCGVIDGDFWRCGNDTYWDFSHVQTRLSSSVMSCALWCAADTACIGLNVCALNGEPVFSCTTFSENISAVFSCDSPLMSTVNNCTVSKKGNDNLTSDGYVTVTQESCSSSYGKVFETTHDGDILYGNKSELIEKVRNGVEVKILLWNLNSKDQLFSISHIEVNNQEVCAQSVFSTVQGIFFSYQILLICSSGYVQEQRWIVGLGSKERDFTAFVTSTWFAGGKCRTPVTMLHDISSALHSGQDFMVLVENSRLPLNVLNDLGTDIVAQFPWSVPLIPSVANKYTSNIDGDCIWQSHVLDFSGSHYITNWKSGNGDHISTVKSNDQVTWMLDTDWILVYENSDSGNTLYGSLSDLRHFVDNAGHRVRIVFNTFSAETDSLYIQNDIISAIIESFTEPPHLLHRVIIVVSTTGTVQEFIYGLVSTNITQNTTTTTGTKWYIDKMEWSELLSVHKGVVELSVATLLEDAMYSGKAFRTVYCTANGNVSLSGVSVTLPVSGSKCMTLIVKQHLYFTTQTGQLAPSVPVGNVFLQFLSSGSVKVNIYDNDANVPRFSQHLKSESFRWFVGDVWQNG
ncbi:uncharacterized protein [Argopecten irradians]|uniref:uncharacterized protein isoform X1 n=1 Tax=Argopecten irradians TaxID=31199 RepID=UPI003721B6A9